MKEKSALKAGLEHQVLPFFVYLEAFSFVWGRTMEIFLEVLKGMPALLEMIAEAVWKNLNGVSLFLAAGAAWATLLLFQRRTLYTQWVDGFRSIYAEFWKDEDISKVKRWLSSDQEYDTLKSILIERLKTDNNNLDPDANEILEKLDRFLALILRVISFNKRKMNNDQRKLWHHLYEQFWMDKLYSRVEVKMYIEKYWKYLYSQTYDQRTEK